MHNFPISVSSKKGKMTSSPLNSILFSTYHSTRRSKEAAIGLLSTSFLIFFIIIHPLLYLFLLYPNYDNCLKTASTAVSAALEKNHLSKMNINEERWFLFVLFLGSLECVYLFAHRIIHVPQ
ncbi:MAG: hypothetical protein IIY30_09405, partial [Erysipelotrichaceae bacterium]|nr:hypothetical protein [Erysipelotrichaceae bacterium]